MIIRPTNAEISMINGLGEVDGGELSGDIAENSGTIGLGEGVGGGL
jgi:hypothetical protein